MRLPERVTAALERFAYRVMDSRPPDQVIGGEESPYLLRWWVAPWRRFRAGSANPTRWQRFVSRLPNVYVHRFMRSDDDRALHDHPWANCSILVEGSYCEHTIAAGGIHVRTARVIGDVVFRRAKAAHRVEVVGPPPVSIFVTGFRLRDWGFHCPEEGWIPWRRFTNPADDGATVGKGCAG